MNRVIIQVAHKIPGIVWAYYKWESQKRIKKSIMIHELGYDEIVKALSLAVEYAYISGVVGDIAEFGTQTGRTARVIAKAIKRQDVRVPPLSYKDLLLFDSFEGLPEIKSATDKAHPFVVSGGWRQGSLKGLKPGELLSVIRKVGLQKSRIKIYPGWFCDTISKLSDDTKLSMLHVDGDLYQSAIDVLDNCFSREFVSEGAIILFDDWNMAGASPMFGERKAWTEMVEKFKIQYSDAGGYSWNGHKFIIHSYDMALDFIRI